MNFRHENMLDNGAPARLGQKHFDGVGDTDHANEEHDHALEPLKSQLLDGQDQHHANAGDNRCGKHGNAE